MAIDLVALKAWFDAHPEKYKTHNLEVNADGYSPTGQLENLLAGSYGEVPNPVPAPGVTKPVTAAALAGAAQATLAAIGAGPNYLSEMEVIASRVRAGDNAGVASWADTLLMLQKMPQLEHDAVVALTQETIPDPSWPATVPAPSDALAQFGVASISAADINAALGRQS